MASEGIVLPQQKVAVGALALLGVLLLDGVRRLLSRGKGQAIPTLPGGWPFIGHFFAMMRYCPENNSLALSRWSLDVERTTGWRTFVATLMGYKFITIGDPDMAEEVMQADLHVYTKDLKDLPMGGDLLEVSYKDGLFFANSGSESWQIPHRILKSPFSIRGIRALMPSMCEQADKLVVALKHDVGDGGETFIETWVTKMAFETIAVSGLGVSFGCFEDSKIHPFVQAMNDANAAIEPLSRWPAFLRPIFCRDLLKQFLDNVRTIRATCAEVIEKRREAGPSEGQKDLMDMMLWDVDSKTGKRMMQDMIVDNVLTFLLGGQDSTAASMSSCLSFLCDKPECKERLIREIDSVVGKGPLDWSDLPKLQYLDWCIKETMRLIPPASSVFRMSAKEQLIGGKWRMPKGGLVLVNIMSLHYNKDLWGEDAEEFKPERWERNPAHRYAYIPFASGPRGCIGREFTLVEQKVTMVKLFQNFDFLPTNNVKAGDDYALLDYTKANYPPFLGIDTYVKSNSAFLGLFRSFTLKERKDNGSC